MKKKRIFYLPIETKNRELLGKTLLATRAASRGWVVVMGMRSKLKRIAPDLLPGFFSEISIPDRKLEKSIMPLISGGHVIGNICEEGVVYPDARDYCERKVGAEALKYIQLFLATGQKQMSDVMTYRDTSKTKMLTTGNCRFDVLRSGLRVPYELGAKKIIDSVGRYILVNTNFSLVNPHPSYGDRMKYMVETGKLSTQAQIALWRDMAIYKKGVMEDFMSALTDISRLFDRKIVIRPHPSENHIYWKQWAESKVNIDIIYQGDVNEWIAGADVVLHEGCTTGIEAFLLGRPVFAYSQYQDSLHFKNIPNQVSSVASSKNDLFEMLAALVDSKSLNDDLDRSIKSQTLKFYIENVDGELAADKILDGLDNIDIPDYTEFEIDKNFAIFKKFESEKNIFKRFSKMTYKNWAKQSAVQKQKFDSLELEEIMQPIRTWLERGCIGGMPDVKQLDDGLFLFSGH